MGLDASQLESGSFSLPGSLPPGGLPWAWPVCAGEAVCAAQAGCSLADMLGSARSSVCHNCRTLFARHRQTGRLQVHAMTIKGALVREVLDNRRQPSERRYCGHQWAPHTGLIKIMLRGGATF